MTPSGINIGINALYLIPGQVGGTEIYLRELLAALAELDTTNQYFVFTNHETGAIPQLPNFHWKPQPVRAVAAPLPPTSRHGPPKSIPTTNECLQSEATSMRAPSTSCWPRSTIRGF